MLQAAALGALVAATGLPSKGSNIWGHAENPKRRSKQRPCRNRRKLRGPGYAHRKKARR